MFATSTKRETCTVNDESIIDTSFFFSFLPQFKGQNKVSGRLRWLGRIGVPTTQGDVRVY